MTKEKIIKITKKEELRDIILLGKFDNSIQVKNNKHICQDGFIYNYSYITDMSFMFDSYSELKTIPLLDTSNITTMEAMFKNCESLTTIPLLDTSNVTNMSGMFWSCEKLETIPLLNTTNVTNMYGMFFNCNSLTTIPLLNTSNVVKISFMFMSCNSLITIPLLDSSNITNINNMNNIFFNCSLSKIEQIKFFYQTKDKPLLNSLEQNPELFSEDKLKELLSNFN